jgi:DNA invertase Pin-like site-specific DNA recombinase
MPLAFPLNRATLWFMSTGTKAPSKVIAYLRVSTDEQANGLAVQRAEIERWAAARGAAVAAWFVDRGVSGGASLEKRPALLEALGVLSKGDVLVVQKRDRLARDVGNAILVEGIVAKAKAALVSAHGEGGDDAEDPMAFAFRRMADVFAQVERMQISARTKAALASKKTRGECVGTVPYGFHREGAALVEDAAEQSVLECVRGFAAAGLSQRAIVAELTAAGFVARSGKAFQKTQVQRILAGAA